jgi:hypothetical protein
LIADFQVANHPVEFALYDWHDEKTCEFQNPQSAIAARVTHLRYGNPQS